MRFLSIVALVASAYAVERSTVMHRVRVANISLADKDTVVFADEGVPRFSAVHADLSAAASVGGDFDLPPALDATGPNVEMGVDVSKFAEKIKAIDEKMVETRKKIKEAIVGCEKVTLLKSAYTALNAERDRITAKKRKVVLQAKLDKQNADLNVIDRMADNLRDRFSELRQTQSALRSNIQGTAEDLQNVMGKASKTPAGPAKSPLVSDMFDLHKDQVEAVGATQAGNLDKLVDFFKDTLHMPVEDPSKPKPAAKKKASF